MVKGLANLAYCSQFAKVIFAKIYDEACDYTICVTEHMCKLNTQLNNYVCSYKALYEIKRQLLNHDLYDY